MRSQMRECERCGTRVPVDRECSCSVVSGRRAAENTNTTPDDAAHPRCVFFTPREQAAITRFADGKMPLSYDREAIAALQKRMDAAPADPAGAAFDVMLESIEGDRIHSEPISVQNATDAVLVALGLPKEDV